MILPHYLTLAFGVLCPVWAPPYKKEIDILDQVQQVPPRDGGKHDLQDKSERSGLFSLEKRGLESPFSCLQLFDQRIQRKWSQTLLGSVW